MEAIKVASNVNERGSIRGSNVKKNCGSILLCFLSFFSVLFLIDEIP